MFTKGFPRVYSWNLPSGVGGLNRLHLALRSLGTALLVILASGAAHAKVYQVGPTRTYKKPEAVATLLLPGDVVEIDGNASYTGGVVFTVHGTTAKPITVRGLRVLGRRPMLQGGVNTVEARANNYVFEGLELTGGTSRCFFHHADNIVLRDSVIHDCPKMGLLGADNDSGDLLMEYVEVYRTGSGTYNHQVYMATDELAYPGSVFRMQHCWLHDANGGNNVKSRAQRNEIYYNWIEGALYHELELIGPDPEGGVPENTAREDSDVVGNVLRKTGTSFVVRVGGDGTGQTFGRYRFVSNTIIVQPNGYPVFRLFEGLESIEMHCNALISTNGTGVNVVRDVEAVWAGGSRIVAGSRNWVQSGSTSVPREWTGTKTGATPDVVNLSNLQLTPRSGSPLVNAGNDAPATITGHAFPNPLTRAQFHPPVRTVAAPGGAAARPVSGVVDIGAFEYVP
jgi:hypothetical protein